MTQVDTILNSFIKILKNQLDCSAVNEKGRFEVEVFDFMYI